MEVQPWGQAPGSPGAQPTKECLLLGSPRVHPKPRQTAQGQPHEIASRDVQRRPCIVLLEQGALLLSEQHQKLRLLPLPVIAGDHVPFCATAN